MRFRLANTGTRQLESGIGNMFSAMAMAPLYQAQAAEEAETAGMKRRLYESQIGENLARAAIAEQERKQLAGRGDVLDLMGATRAGTNVPLFRAAVQERQAPAVEGPPVIGGAVDPRRLDDAITTLYGPAMASPADKVNWDQIAGARGKYQTQDVLDQVLAGRTPAATAAQAVAASKGNRLVDNIGETGGGFNIFSGQGVELDPALRVLFGDKVGAQVTRDRAAAGASGAAGRLSDARRERVVGGFDKPVTVVDEDTGEATVTLLPTQGAPRSVGVAPKKGTGVDATNAKERNRVTTAVEKEMIGASDEEIAAEVERRMARRGAPSKAPAAAPAAPQIDMAKAADVKARFKAGKLTRAQAQAELRALGFK